MGVIVLLLLVVAVGVLWYANHYLQTPEFKQRVLAAARQSLGTDVKINEINVSLFKGVTLKGITVANQPGFDGDLLTADKFVLRYSLLPLLHKQVHIEQLLLTRGTVVIPGKNNKALVKAENIDVSTSVDFVGRKLSGSGKANIETLNIADSIFVRALATPVSFQSDSVKLSPLSGKLADGDVSGDLTLRVVNGTQYQLNLQVKDTDVNKLLQEAGVAKRPLNGKLQATAALAGTGGFPTIVGKGRAEIVGGELKGVPALELVGALLQIPELSNLRFDQCVIEFSISNNVMQTPVVKLTSPKVQITGKGEVSLDDCYLDYDLTLALANDALANLPKEVRGIFTERSDGFLTLNFRVWGPYDKPKTDLTKRIVKSVTDQLIGKDLKKLFK